MKYVTTLEHDDFVMLMDVLTKAREAGVIAWSATAMVCENTKIKF
jgi:hypothetical protein